MSLYRATRGEGVFIQGHQWMRVSLYRGHQWMRVSLYRGGGGSNSIFVHGHQIFAKCTCTKCTKMYIYVFSCLEVPWIDLLAVANLQ